MMRQSLSNPGFHSNRCKRCGHYWASSATMPGLVINSFCPMCIPKITHVLTDAPVAGIVITEESRREHMAAVNAMRAKDIRRLRADVYRLQERYPTRPLIREARRFLRCDQHHVIQVMWFAYERPSTERESA